MPHYSYEHTFIAGGDKAHQEEEEMECSQGILKNVMIAFAAGCHGVVHIHIDETLHQIFPTNPNGTYKFNDVAVIIYSPYVLLPSTRKIYLRGWNEGIYNHTIYLSFEIEPAEKVSAVDKAILEMAKIIKEVLT